jgi:hypothetical protein
MKENAARKKEGEETEDRGANTTPGHSFLSLHDKTTVMTSKNTALSK